uniref:Protein DETOXIFICATION n=1 Tax=Brassica campestris TaxID=3711 RepID=M4DS46_BRACM
MAVPLILKNQTDHRQDPHPNTTTHLSSTLQEAKSIAKLSLPMILTGLLLYSRSMISMLFLGRLNDLSALSGGSLALGFANITGYSLLSEPRFCSCIYLRALSITLPLTYSAFFAVILHIPINYLLVSSLGLGLKGVALGAIWTNVNLLGFLIIYIAFSGLYEKTWGGFSIDCFKGWRSLMKLAIPSCVSVCLEWWWYEIMILLCGLLLNPQATVASMGILIQTTALIYIFPSSLSVSVSTRVGNELGANQPEKARTAARTGLWLSLGLGLIAMFFALIVRNCWARLFTGEEEILKLTSMVLPIIGLCELGNCPQTTMCGVLRGSARPKLGANINLCCFYFVGMPVAIWLSFFSGFDFKGLWLGMFAAQGSCLVSMLVVLGKTDWEAEVHRAKELMTRTSDGDGEDDNGSGSNTMPFLLDSLDIEESGNYRHLNLF